MIVLLLLGTLYLLSAVAGAVFLLGYVFYKFWER